MNLMDNEIDKALSKLETFLIDAANNLSTIYDLTTNFSENKKGEFKQLLQQFGSQIEKINQECEEMDEKIVENLIIPRKIIEDLDEGYKPDSYGKECLENYKRNHENEIIRSEGLNTLYKYLCEEIKVQFGEELANHMIQASQE